MTAVSSFDDICREFDAAIAACRELYVSSAHRCLEQCPHLVPGTPESYIELLDNLHRGLLFKVFASVATSDRSLSPHEQVLAQRLLAHAFQEPVDDDRLREVLPQVLSQAGSLTWYSLLRPFDVMPPLQTRVGELETIVMRVGNLTAKADGHVSDVEANILRMIQGEVDRHLKLLPVDGQEELRAASTPIIVNSSTPVSSLQGTSRPEPPRPKTSQEQISAALAELDALTGLDSIKREVRTLANVLQMQRQRQELGLPLTPLSLHLVFKGNPGTGKTTVARIIGRIYAALGLLEKGHLVEVDRSALVAEFAGQTGPKTHRKIDEALGGMLFIDEAYSLVAEGREDPYGHEAVQALLKRMEDDRHRLAIILAGYPEPLDRLLTTNPGLSSRFSTQLTFDDYRPGELAKIFQHLCDQNQYQVVGAAQARLLFSLAWLHKRRDEHFGNGRLVRNVFEQSIRRLANRIASVAPLTKELLTTFQADDIAVAGVPDTVVQFPLDKPPRVRLACPECSASVKALCTWLEKNVRCPKCEKSFVAQWGEPVEEN